MNIRDLLEAIRREKKPELNARGNSVYRDWAPAQRHVVDFAHDFHAEGWMQYGTDQDAPYFGLWVNPQKLMILIYAEGDWTLILCPDKAHYNAEIEDTNRFYDEGYSNSSYRQDRTKFLAP